MASFEIKDNFYLDGKPVKIIQVQFIIFVPCPSIGRIDWKN